MYSYSSSLLFIAVFHSNCSSSCLVQVICVKFNIPVHFFSDLLESLSEFIDKDSSALYSDPESEWNGAIKVEEPEDELYHLQPESEQSSETTSIHAKDFRIPGFTYDEMLS